MKTQAAVALSADTDFSIEEVELDDPGSGEVRVKMQACGICRSDLSALEGKETIQFPAVLGHEGAGVVEAVGSEVQSVKEGDNVVLSWTPACGTCAGCRRGEVHLCEEINMTTGGKGPLKLGGHALDRFMALGAFCEHVVVPESMAVPIYSELDATHSCLIGCGVTTGFGAAVNTAAVRWGESVAVFGWGGVGRTATMLDAFNTIRAGGRAVIVGLPAYTEMLELPAIMLLREKSIKGHFSQINRGFAEMREGSLIRVVLTF